MLRETFGTGGLCAIWLLEALNYAVHVVLVPVPWNAYSQAVGYSLWALQLACLARCQGTDPGPVPDAWVERARYGEERCTVCERSGELLPPRAYYIRRHGAVVLGLDHYCSWLGVPIGYRNRRYFIQFVVYSFVFISIGAAHSIYAFLAMLPPQLPAPLWDALAQRRLGAVLWEGGAALHLGFGAFLLFLGRRRREGELAYALLLACTIVLNLLGAVMLGGIACQHLFLVARNRTTLEPRDTRYDVGLRANLAQVFGARPLLWLLPAGGGPASDGVHYPLNPQYKVGGGGASGRGRRAAEQRRRRLVGY